MPPPSQPDVFVASGASFKVLFYRVFDLLLVYIRLHLKSEKQHRRSHNELENHLGQDYLCGTLTLLDVKAALPVRTQPAHVGFTLEGCQ